MEKVYIAGNYPDKFTASGKAKIDAEEIIRGLSYKNIGLPQSHFKIKTFKAYLRLVASIAKFKFAIPKNGIIILQHPCSGDLRYAKIAKSKNNKIILLIHDLNTLRDWNDRGEKELLNLADVIIVHTEAMKNWLVERGFNKDFIVLEVFDYLHGSKVSDKSGSGMINVAFAGNIGKSNFLDKLEFNNIKLNLYGIGIEKRSLGRGLAYQGCFPPDKLAENMSADFGLVWDGDTTDGCSGILGEYLKLIAPHKISMYLSAGIPVIVWDKSAMASFVRDNNIGIIISDLRELDHVLPSINNDRYRTLKDNVLAISEKLSKGFYLHDAIINAEDSLKSRGK